MEETTKYFILGMFVGIFIMLILFAYLYFLDYNAVNVFQLKDDCHTTLRQTCDTVNSVINITDKQSSLLEKCYNVSQNTLPRLSKLNCNGIG